MSTSELHDQSRILGRSSFQLQRMAENLRSRLRSEVQDRPEVDQTPVPRLPPTEHREDVLTIPPAEFAPKKPSRFEFQGYEDRSEDRWPSYHLEAGLLRDRGDEKLRKLEIPPLHQTYMNVTFRMLQSFHQETPISPFQEFQNFVEGREHDSIIDQIWAMLVKLTSVSTGDPITSLISGGRTLFEKKYRKMIQTAVRSGGYTADSGLEMDASHIYMTYGRYRSNQDKLTHNVGQNGELLPWRTLYDALRAGDYEAVDILSTRVEFPISFADYNPAEFFSVWLTSAGVLPLPLMEAAIALCSSILDGMQLAPIPLDERYMVMCLSFVSGQIDFADKLMSGGLHFWDSFDEYLWFTLGCVRCHVDDSHLDMLDLKALHDRVNAYSADYYTKGGRLSLYITLLICTLQFKKALLFLLKMENTQEWIVHVVHMAIALEFTGILNEGGQEDEESFSNEEISQLLEQYSRSFCQIDFQTHWQYHFFALKIRATALQSDEALFYTSLIEILAQHNTQDVELSRMVREALVRFETNEDERNQLYTRVAELLLTRDDLDLSFKCFVAAGKLLEALKTINKLMASKCRKIPCEDLSKYGQQYQQEIRDLGVLLTKFKTVHGRLYGLEMMTVEARQAVNEFNGLQQIFHMLNEMWAGDYHKAMERFQNLTFIPRRPEDIESCKKQLQDGLPLVYSLLHRVFGVFSGCCPHVQRADNQWREELKKQITTFQIFIQTISPSYGLFTSQINQDLATVLRNEFSVET